MPKKPIATVECAQAAIKYIANSVTNGCNGFVCASPRLLSTVTLTLLLGACAIRAATPEATGPLPSFRCEYDIQFTAKFTGDSVTLDSSRGYDVLFRGDKNANNPKNPNEYGNPRMSAEFKLGASGKEALLRYPLLPLAARCVQD